MLQKEYLAKNKEKFLNDLFEFLKIPSVSADPRLKKEVNAAARFLCDEFKKLKIKARLYETKGHPIVYAECIKEKYLPTVLIYGHYDVQPPDPYELWESPPFEPKIRNERVYARGASDDKGQVHAHLKALEIMLNTESLPCNVKFLIEGEEETGSTHLETFVKNNRELLHADTILISDTSILSNELPSITVGLRGLSYVEVTVTAPNRDLHSGLYGGAVTNPVHVLSQMIASLHHPDGKIAIPEFYRDVKAFSEQTRELFSKIPFDLQQFEQALGLSKVAGELGYSTLERIGIRPSLDVNGIWSGYTGEGAKTVIPSKAFAKISMRLVPNQNSETITRLFTEYFHKIAPDTVQIQVTPHQGGQPYVTSTDSTGYRAAFKAMETIWGIAPIPVYDGGSIPIVALFKEVIKVDPVLMGFGLNEDAIHSPNESFGLFNYFRGIETIMNFYCFFAEMSHK